MSSLESIAAGALSDFKLTAEELMAILSATVSTSTTQGELEALAEQMRTDLESQIVDAANSYTSQFQSGERNIVISYDLQLPDNIVDNSVTIETFVETRINTIAGEEIDNSVTTYDVTHDIYVDGEIVTTRKETVSSEDEVNSYLSDFARDLVQEPTPDVSVFDVSSGNSVRVREGGTVKEFGFLTVNGTETDLVTGDTVSLAFIDPDMADPLTGAKIAGTFTIGENMQPHIIWKDWTGPVQNYDPQLQLDTFAAVQSVFDEGHDLAKPVMIVNGEIRELSMSSVSDPLTPGMTYDNSEHLAALAAQVV